uniref:Tpr-related protein family member, putative n=1 Tax=Theileria annulata TaxID=5874 RepID=A0A3B0MK30_THEAN
MAEFGKDPFKISAYMFVGLAMMLNIRLVYSAAPYALLRFKLPENLFSVFVRVMAGSLELWCLPGFVVINIMDFIRKPTGKQWKDYYYHWQSIVVQWLNFVTFVILWISFIIGGDQGNVTAFYWVIAASGFVFGINNPLVYAMEFQYLSWYMIGENSFPMVTSLIHYVGTLLFGNRRKWNSDYIIVTIDIIISLAISFVAAILWTWAYREGNSDGYPPPDPKHKDCTNITLKSSSTDYEIKSGDDHHATACGHKKLVDGYYAYFIPPTLMVIVGMGLVYAIYPGIAPGMIVPFYLVDKIEMVLLIATTVPPIIIGILKNYGINPYVNMGNWGLYHEKVCKATTGSDTPSPLGVCSGTIVATLNAQITGANLTGNSPKTLTLTLNTAGATITVDGDTDSSDNSNGQYTLASGGTLTVNNINLDGDNFPYTLTSIGTLTATSLQLSSGTPKNSVTIKQDTLITLKPTVSEAAQLTVNGANGKTLKGPPFPFSLGAYKVTTKVTLNTSTQESISTNNTSNSELHSGHSTNNCCFYGKVFKWESNPMAWYWNIFTILAPFQICLAAIFIYSLHYRDSKISRAIVNQPKMSTALSIMFYMCHEILLAMGFPGVASDDYVLLPMQLIGAYLMVLLAYYSVGYITEYKRHDPSQWPTEGMTKWNAMCYWLKMASKITNKNFRQLFTTDRLADIFVFIIYNVIYNI